MLLGRVRGCSTQASWRGRDQAAYQAVPLPIIASGGLPSDSHSYLARGHCLQIKMKIKKVSITASMLSCRRRRWRSQGLAAMQKCAACCSEERDVAKTCSVLARPACEGHRPHSEAHRAILRSIALRCAAKDGCNAWTRGHPSRRRALRRKSPAERARLLATTAKPLRGDEASSGCAI
jgi:hypothetical protein